MSTYLRAETGRLYLEPEPEAGSHPGYRGDLTLTDYGVRVHADRVEFLRVEPGEYNGTWELSEVNELIPWHRVHSIEFAECWALKA